MSIARSKAQMVVGWMSWHNHSESENYFRLILLRHIFRGVHMCHNRCATADVPQ